MYGGFVDRVVARAGAAVEFRRAGTLEVAVDDDDVERLRHSNAALASAGVDAEWMDGDAVRRLEPTLGPHVVGGLLIPSHAIVNVPAFTAACAAAAVASGAVVRDGITVTGLAGDASGLAVHTTEGPLRARHVVLATGAWSAALVPAGAVAAPVEPVRGQLVHLKTLPGTLTRVLWGRDVYIVPWTDGAIYVGATSEHVGFDERTTADGVAGLLAAAAALAPGLMHASFVAARAGLRPGTDDSLPFIGLSAVQPGVCYACGHYRNGALLAPLTAQLVASVLDGDLSDPALSLVAPSRAGRL